MQERAPLAGGSTGPGGWLKDKFGLSGRSRSEPDSLREAKPFTRLADPDAEKANRVMKAIMEADKIDIAALNKAAMWS